MTKFASLTLCATVLTVWGGGAAAGRLGGEAGAAAQRGQASADQSTEVSSPAADRKRTEATRPRSAATELKRARDLLLKANSIQARIVETVSIYDRGLDRGYKAEGRYLQLGLKSNDWHMRLELTLKVGDSEGSLMEVCDGEILWTSSQVDSGRKGGRKDKKEQSITRRDVTKILAAAARLGPQVENDQVTRLGLGGMPALLASLEREMKFSGVKEETLRDRPVLVVQGTWTDTFLNRLRGGQQQRSASASLPSFVPDAARIYLDKETGFPLRLVYRKNLEGREVQRDLLILDFLDVTINEPIDPGEFEYQPPEGVQPAELTNFFLEQLQPPETVGGSAR